MPITMVQIVIHSVLDGTIAVVTTVVIKVQETKSAWMAGGDKTASPVS